MVPDRCKGLATALALAAGLGLEPALAAPGDTHRVTAERVNLRAAPTDDATVRTQVTEGEELLELRRDGSWYGVRVLRTGEEGWIFGDLIQPMTASTLGSEGAAAVSGPFRDLSRDFDQVMGMLAQRLGLQLVQDARQVNERRLEITLTPEWLRAGSANEHLLGAVAAYQMWKNHQNNAAVSVTLLDPEGRHYIVIDETQPGGPVLALDGG